MLTKLIEDFNDKDFQSLFIQYFTELDINVDDYETLFNSMNEENKNKAYILYKDHRPVGFIMFCIEESSNWFIQSSFGFIREFWVDPQYRNKSYGSKLCAACEQYFISNQVYTSLLTTDTAENFYLKHGYTYSFDHRAKNEDDVYIKNLYDLKIEETTRQDLSNLKDLWNNGDVMRYVGFPEGLIMSDEAMNDWYHRLQESRHSVKHYTITLNHKYCGESYYSIDKYGYTALDIKLLPFSRGLNIAYQALFKTIEEAFENESAKFVYVDPHPDNHKALKLYERLNFTQVKHPSHLDVADTYQQISKENWNTLK